METLNLIENKTLEVFQPRHISTYLSTAGGQFGTGYLWSCTVDFVCHFLLAMSHTNLLWRFIVMCTGILLNTVGILVAVQLYGPSHSPDTILHLIPFQMGLSLGQPLFMATAQNFAKDIKSGLFSHFHGTAAPPVSEEDD